MHTLGGDRDPGTTFTLRTDTDDLAERRAANRAVAVSAVGLALTGAIELAVALVGGSVALLGDALHNLSDVSTSLIVFVGFRASRRSATAGYPYGYGRAEDLAGVGIAVVIWASAVLAGYESVHKLISGSGTREVGWGIAAAAVGIAGNQLVARYKLRIGRRINSVTLISDARHSWLDALSSAGALVGLVGVASGLRIADALAGLVVTGFVCHVGWEVSADMVRRLMDGVDPRLVEQAEQLAAGVTGVEHAHARARWSGRALVVEVEAWLDGDRSLADATALGQDVADRLADGVPGIRAFTWIPRAAVPVASAPVEAVAVAS